MCNNFKMNVRSSLLDDEGDSELPVDTTSTGARTAEAATVVYLALLAAVVALTRIMRRSSADSLVWRRSWVGKCGVLRKERKAQVTITLASLPLKELY